MNFSTPLITFSIFYLKSPSLFIILEYKNILNTCDVGDPSKLFGGFNQQSWQ
jgi:hypothetical protein